MAIASVDDIAAGLSSSAKSIPIAKTLTAPKAAGAFQSSWLANGNPGPGVAPSLYSDGSGYTCDKDTAGAIQITNGAVQLWLAKLALNCTQPGVIILADRLWSCSGIGFASGTYTITTPGNLPARITDNGVGCELWIEQFVAAGSASGTLTANYLNANDGSAKSGVISAVVSAPVIGQMQPVPLAAGDTGIRQLTSIAHSNTWTSGSIGATILKRITEAPIIAANGGVNLDWAQLALPKIPNDACLFAFFLANGTTAPVILGSITTIDK